MSFKVWIQIEDLDKIEDPEGGNVGEPDDFDMVFGTVEEAEDFVQKLRECSTEEGE